MTPEFAAAFVAACGELVDVDKGETADAGGYRVPLRRPRRRARRCPPGARPSRPRRRPGRRDRRPRRWRRRRARPHRRRAHVGRHLPLPGAAPHRATGSATRRFGDHLRPPLLADGDVGDRRDRRRRRRRQRQTRARQNVPTRTRGEPRKQKQQPAKQAPSSSRRAVARSMAEQQIRAMLAAVTPEPSANGFRPRSENGSGRTSLELPIDDHDAALLVRRQPARPAPPRRRPGNSDAEQPDVTADHDRPSSQ